MSPNCSVRTIDIKTGIERYYEHYNIDRNAFDKWRIIVAGRYDYKIPHTGQEDDASGAVSAAESKGRNTGGTDFREGQCSGAVVPALYVYRRFKASNGGKITMAQFDEDTRISPWTIPKEDRILGAAGAHRDAGNSKPENEAEGLDSFQRRLQAAHTS